MRNRFAIRLRKYREYMGESRPELSSAIGATVAAIRTWEDGIHSCSFDTLLNIAEHYGITTDYLLGNTPFDEPESAKKEADPLPVEDRLALLRYEEFLRQKNRH